MVIENKKGWIRIVEAFIAVIIIIGAVLIVIQSNKIQNEKSFCSLLPGILEEISKNDSLRQAVFDNNSLIIQQYAQNKVQHPSFIFRAKICLLNDLCVLTESGLDKIDICAEQRIISTSKNQTAFSPMKLKLFLFRV